MERRKGIIYVYFNRAKYEKEGIEKYYVGQTVYTMEERAGKHGEGYGALDENCNTKFARSIRKWGWDAFEGIILEEVYEEDLNELEMFYIEQFDSYKNGYNCTLGGEGTRGYNLYENKNEEEIKEICKKMSKAAKKRYEDPKEREKTSKTNKKRLEDPKEREKCSQPGEKNPNAKSVYSTELNIIFSYMKVAEKYCVNILNSSIPASIVKVCKCKINYSGKLTDGTKLTWKYAEDVDKETLDKATYIDSAKYNEELLNKNVNDCNEKGA